MPNGSDNSWVIKLIEKCTKYNHFEKPRFGNNGFLIKHFSDTVEYTAHGFLEKNRDTVSKELVGVLRESAMGFCRKLVNLEEEILKESLSKDNLRVVVSAAKVQVFYLFFEIKSFFSLF